MKFSCKSKDLQKGISVVEKAISLRTPLQIMENIFLSTADNKLTLVGNNLEVGIQYEIPIENLQESGRILIKAQTISNVISKMEDQNVDVSVDLNQKVLIHSGGVDFDLHGQDINDYPVLPNIESGIKFTLSADQLSALIKHTFFSVCYDDAKPFLNGVFIKAVNQKLTFVATDGFRMAMDETICESIQNDFEVIIPNKAIGELNKILQILHYNDPVEVIVTDTLIKFSWNSFKMVSRLIQGRFPDYKQVVLDESSIKNQYRVPRKTLVTATERASIIANYANQVVRIYFKQNEVIVKAKALKTGEFREGILISEPKHTGDLRISFNVKLLLDALKNIESDDILIEFNDELCPCIFKPVSEENYLYVIMPIRMTDFEGE